MTPTIESAPNSVVVLDFKNPGHAPNILTVLDIDQSVQENAIL